MEKATTLPTHAFADKIATVYTFMYYIPSTQTFTIGFINTNNDVSELLK